MAHFLSTTLILAVAAIANAQVPHFCAVDGYNYYPVLARCVKFYAFPANISMAEAVCRNDTGYLISLHSLAEADELFGEVVTSSNTYIGAVYDNSTQKYRWLDGSPWDYTQFATTEHRGCTIATHPEWYDVYCETENYFTCELTAPQYSTTTGGITTTSPSTTSMLTTSLVLSTTTPSVDTTPTTTATSSSTSSPTARYTTALPTTTSNGSCPKDWLTSVSRANTCYYVYDSSQVDYFNAMRFCSQQSPNAHVLVLHNSFETSEIRDLITTTFMWLGLDRSTGTFAWSDEEPLSYTNWANGEPAANFDCAQISRSTGKWSTVDCDSRLPLICQLYV